MDHCLLSKSVHYVCPTDQYVNAGQERAAEVVRVCPKTGNVDLLVRKSHLLPGMQCGNVFLPGKVFLPDPTFEFPMFRVEGVTHCPKGTPGTYHLPEEVTS